MKLPSGLMVPVATCVVPWRSVTFICAAGTVQMNCLFECILVQLLLPLGFEKPIEEQLGEILPSVEHSSDPDRPVTEMEREEIV